MDPLPIDLITYQFITYQSERLGRTVVKVMKPQCHQGTYEKCSRSGLILGLLNWNLILITAQVLIVQKKCGS